MATPLQDGVGEKMKLMSADARHAHIFTQQGLGAGITHYSVLSLLLCMPKMSSFMPPLVHVVGGAGGRGGGDVGGEGGDRGVCLHSEAKVNQWN